MGQDFTAKHFRTWGASVLAFDALASAGHDISLKTMLETVTQALGNTPAIARQFYVHPRLVDLATEGQETFRSGLRLLRTIGSASCRKRVCQDWSILVVA